MDEISLALIILLYGFARGCVYGVIALGLNLIFGTMKIVNLAHGALCLLSAYIIYSLFYLSGFDPYGLIIPAVLIFFVIGLGLYFGIFQRTRDPNSSTISSFGLLVMLQMIMVIFWTANPKTVPSIYSNIMIPLRVVSISLTRVILIIVCIAATIFLSLLLKKTIFGKAVRGVSEDAETATLMGISISKVNSLAFSLGIALACLAGIIYGINYSFDPYIGLMLTLKGFVSLTLGGLGNPIGAITGGVILGIVENVIAYGVGASWSDVASYFAFILILLIKPTGIFGKGRWLEILAKAGGISPTQLSRPKTASTKFSTTVIVGLLTMLLLLALPLSMDVERSYPLYFLYNIFIYIALSTSWNIVSGFAGQFSLGHNAFFGLGAYITAIAWRAGLIGYFDIRAFLLSAIVSAIVAASIGYPFLGRLHGFYFSLGTLGLSEVFRLLAINGGEVTGGAVGIQLPSRYYAGFMQYYYTAFLLMMLSVFLSYALFRGKVGLNLRAIRDDEIAAESMGIPALGYKILAFSLSSIVPAMCGSLWAYYIFHVQPSSAFGLTWGLYPALMGIIGGIGTLLGPIIGSVIIGSIVQLVSIYAVQAHPLISGFLLIITVVFLPQGVLGKIHVHKKS